jgi:hypothetical protein
MFGRKKQIPRYAPFVPQGKRDYNFCGVRKWRVAGAEWRVKTEKIKEADNAEAQS